MQRNRPWRRKSPHFGGLNAPPSNFFISGVFSASGTSQSMQRNLRPPLLTSMNLVALPHFEQAGGGVFLAMDALAVYEEEHYRALCHR